MQLYSAVQPGLCESALGGRVFGWDTAHEWIGELAATMGDAGGVAFRGEVEWV